MMIKPVQSSQCALVGLMSDQEPVSVPAERIQRVIDILSMVSIGEYNPEMIHIPPSDKLDEFSVLEAALNIYNQELATARAQNERYIQEMEDSRRALQDQLATIARQQLAIHELSSPIAEIWEDILLLPVIGALDSQRALEMTEKLLERIKQSRSACVIIDITGVEGVESTTATAMLKMTRAARLLGAVCVLTGVRPEIARTMAQLNIDVEDIKMLRSLKDGLRTCFDILRTRRDAREKRARERRGGLLNLLPFSASSGNDSGAARQKPVPTTEHPSGDRSVPVPMSLSEIAALGQSDGSGRGSHGR